MNRNTIIAIAVVVVAAGAAWWKLGHGSEATTDSKERVPPALMAANCSHLVTKDDLEKSVAIGTQFMIAHQKPAGNFDYEYDWKAKRNSSDDNAVRQAGALWGISLLHAHAGDKAPPELTGALDKGIKYFDEPSRMTANGGRYPVYRGDTDQPVGAKAGMGIPALIALAIIDDVRSLPADSPDKARLTARANEYVSFIASALRPDGLWPGEYRYDDGSFVGAPSSYSDGEALLALSEAMKYLPRPDLKPIIERAAKAGHQLNIVDAQAKENDSDTTKGYYQWSSMAFYELATSDMANPSQYGDWLMSLADWVLDTHRVLTRPRNTGYAFEGLVSAYKWAKQVNDPRAEKYRCAIHQGLSNLLSWQIGHPRAAKLGGGDDPKAVGGVQNHAVEPGLRIDTIQHQLHATMLAEDALFP